MNTLLIICLFFVVLNFLFNFFIGLFVVKFQQNLFSRLDSIFSALEEDISIVPPTAERNMGKTWDQKYEEELNAFKEAVARDKGLTDL